MNVSLKAEWATFIEQQVSGGEYDTASEVVRAGLRLLKREAEERKAKMDAFKAAMLVGIEQARAGKLSSADEFFAELDAEMAAEDAEDRAGVVVVA